MIRRRSVFPRAASLLLLLLVLTAPALAQYGAPRSVAVDKVIVNWMKDTLDQPFVPQLMRWGAVILVVFVAVEVVGRILSRIFRRR